MTVKEYMESTFTGSPYLVRPRVVCKDGFSISIQGGDEFHYCDPRKNTNQYNALELGFPSELDDLISEYAEEENTTQTVYGWVPIEVVERLISKHGGIESSSEVSK